MESNFNKQNFNNPEKGSSVRVLPFSILLFFLMAVFITLNGCSLTSNKIEKEITSNENVKEQQFTFKSDNELITNYQKNRADYQQVIQKIKEINELKAQLKKETDEFQRQLKINNEDNRNNETQRKSNEEKIRAEWQKVGDLFSKSYKPKYKEINEAVKKIGNQAYDPYNENSRIILDRSFKYDDTKQNDGYHISEGFVLFDENTQPDPRFVVDNIDNFHDSGNIITTYKKILSKFPPKTTFKGTIYLPVEGNFYLYLNVWKSSLSGPGPSDGPW